MINGKIENLKALLINNLYTPNGLGGAERFVQSLAEGIVEAGHQSIVISVSPTAGTQVRWVAGVKIYYIGLKNLYWPWGTKRIHTALKPAFHVLDSYHPWMAREVASILDAEQPNVIHTNNLAGFSTLVWQRIKQQGLPLVHTLHDYYLLCPQGNMFRNGRNCRTQCIECRLYSLPRKHYSNLVDVVVGVSRFVLKRHLERGYFSATPRKEVIANNYRPEAGALPLGTPPLPIRFGYLGKLSTDKGVEILLESVTQLPKGTWTLNVAGQGHTAYEAYLRAKYNGPAIKFLGYIRPESFFSKIDVLVVPSLWHEAFGRAIIEAYAHGVPVIGSNRGGITELVEEGRTGFLFEPDHPDDLAKKMQRYIDKTNIVCSMRPNCLKKAPNFLPESIVEQYLEVWGDLIERRT